jgi:carboxyl-terminal processing protease
MQENAIYRRATAGMLAELGDPYAALVSERDTASLERPAGPPPQGLYLDLVDESVAVVAVVPNSPGAAASVQPGDLVLRVDDTPVDKLRPEVVGPMIDGKPGSTVRLRLDRAGTRPPLWVTITRGPVPDLPPPAVTALGSGITELKLYRIDRAAAELAARVGDSTLKAGGKGVVLDLRGVVEGTLEDAVALAGGFLQRGQTIVTSRGREVSDSTRFVDQHSDRAPDLALVVLVDRGTSGAAEVVAGALQDHDRAAIVGEATFGRGARQTLYPVGTGYLKLTTSRWMTPSGRLIQRPLPPAPGAAPVDSAAARPKFQTEGGRTVLGGGGIVPDREVSLGGDEPGGADPALALARQLLNRAKDRKALIEALAVR